MAFKRRDFDDEALATFVSSTDGLFVDLDHNGRGTWLVFQESISVSKNRLLMLTQIYYWPTHPSELLPIVITTAAT